MSSEIVKQKLDSVPDQTSSEEQMENWSKDTHILEQKKEDFCVEFQFHQNSQKNPEFFIQAEAEALKLSDLSVTSQRRGAPNNCNSSPEESRTIERKANRMLPEFISSWKDAADLGRKTETAFLLKELDTLRAKNKKLQDKLSEKDKELKTIKLDLELQEKATEAKIAEKIAALVEEVYSAQRERDKAVMARLRLANEERDEAFLRLQRLEESLKDHVLEDQLSSKQKDERREETPFLGEHAHYVPQKNVMAEGTGYTGNDKKSTCSKERVSNSIRR